MTWPTDRDAGGGARCLPCVHDLTPLCNASGAAELRPGGVPVRCAAALKCRGSDREAAAIVGRRELTTDGRASGGRGVDC